MQKLNEIAYKFYIYLHLLGQLLRFATKKSDFRVIQKYLLFFFNKTIIFQAAKNKPLVQKA